jgi:hypothetical protein
LGPVACDSKPRIGSHAAPFLSAGREKGERGCACWWFTINSGQVKIPEKALSTRVDGAFFGC